jgi:ribosome biogenesis GTPase
MNTEGIVFSGINNIYLVFADNKEWECRIKGKVLKEVKGEYNPIAVGDRVTIEINPHMENHALIISRLKRRNSFIRWNKKRRAPQTVAANIDLLVAVVSPESPPFRPRFVDRVLVAAWEQFPVLIVLNKSDQKIDPSTMERLEDFDRLGYPFHLCSAKTGEGVEELRRIVSGKIVAFVGQSGVGKSSILNRMHPGLKLRVGEVSAKYNRGRHTTNSAVMIPVDDWTLIDTPGIREIEVHEVDVADLQYAFPDFQPFARDCAFQPCMHDKEPECAVRDAVGKSIHPDRYESYLRILADLRYRLKGW